MDYGNLGAPMKRTLLWTIVVLSACKATDPGSPLVDLANRLFLDGEWGWTDSMMYSAYVPAGDSVEHHGAYVLIGTATLEPVDSADIETYVLDAVADLMHVDSTAGEERELWSIPELAFQDTVFVRNDTIFKLGVEPIPPQANPNANRIRWVLDASKLCAPIGSWTRSPRGMRRTAIPL
jgi:hypothetical protein